MAPVFLPTSLCAPASAAPTAKGNRPSSFVFGMTRRVAPRPPFLSRRLGLLGLGAHVSCQLLEFSGQGVPEKLHFMSSFPLRPHIPVQHVTGRNCLGTQRAFAFGAKADD